MTSSTYPSSKLTTICCLVAIVMTKMNASWKKDSIAILWKLQVGTRNLQETSIGAEFGQLLLFRKFCECLLVFTQQVSLYFGISLRNKFSSKKFCRYHHWYQILIRGRFPCTSWVSVQFFTQICHCSPLKWMDFTPFPSFSFLLFPRRCWHEMQDWPLSAKLSIMPSTVFSHSPSGLLTWVPYHFLLDPGPRNDQCPRVNLRAYSVTLTAFAIQFSLFPRFVQSMSLYIDMKMILPLNCLLWFTLWFSHHLLNLVENSQCSESWEILPLELHQLPVDPIQFSFLKWILRSSPSKLWRDFDWSLPYTILSQHLITELPCQ